jgi:hypothetical protein
MAADNDYPAMFAGVSSPYVGGETVSPSDTVSLTKVSRAIYVGTVGTLSCLMMDGTTVALPTTVAGTIYPLRVERVNLTGTSATNIRALW